MKFFRLIIILACVSFSQSSAGISNRPFIARQDVQAFISEMVTDHHFNREELNRIFTQVQFPKIVITKSDKPAEAMTWERYRNIVVNDRQINGGVVFWKKYKKELTEAHKRFGVPEEIIVATISLESDYGRNSGKFRVIDSLTNLAFNYPRRAGFFKSELKEYLLLTREMHLDPLVLMGSYAGAIGQPQFMPSSYRRYAIDFSGNNHIDLVNNQVDVIGSIANFYNRYARWRPDEPITVRADITGKYFYKAMSEGRHPEITLRDAERYGVMPRKNYVQNYKTNLISLKNKEIEEFWLIFENFYAIKRYNASTYYAMAIYQLSQEIKKKYESVN